MFNRQILWRTLQSMENFTKSGDTTKTNLCVKESLQRQKFMLFFLTGYTDRTRGFIVEKGLPLDNGSCFERSDPSIRVESCLDLGRVSLLLFFFSASKLIESSFLLPFSYCFSCSETYRVGLIHKLLVSFFPSLFRHLFL